MKFRLNEYGSKNIEKIENLDATNLYDLGNKNAFDMLGIMY